MLLFFVRLKQMADKPRGRRPRGCAWIAVNANTLEPVEKKMPGPRGRPPKGYMWKGGRFVHEITQEPFDDRRHREERQRAWYDTQKQKYWASEGGWRDRKRMYLTIKRRLRGAPARPLKPPNTLLRSGDEKDAESLRKDTDEQQTPLWCEHADTVPQL